MLLLQAAAVADTMLVRQVPPVRTVFEQVVFVASGLTSILTLVVVLLVLAMLIGMRAAAKALGEKLDEVLLELRPLTQNANAASADVRDAAAAAKAMVVESQETVHEANVRVRETVENLTDRVDELAEMIAGIHRTVTRVAGIATTAMGGLRAGARWFGVGKSKKKKPSKVSRAEDRPRPRLRRRDCRGDDDAARRRRGGRARPGGAGADRCVRLDAGHAHPAR